MSRHKGEMAKRICESCANIFYIRPSDIKKGRGIYCSRKCTGEAKITHVALICGICEKPFTKSQSIVNKGWGKYCSKRCYGKAKRKDTNNLKRPIRRLEEYRQWRNNVFNRDKRTCQCCGIRYDKKRGLHAHHIIPIHSIIKIYNLDSIDKALECAKLWDISNGISLCKPCHTLLHSKHKLQMEIKL